MSYETLDAIADSYIPLLLVLFLAGILLKRYKSWSNYQSLGMHFCFLIGILLFSYGLMFIDNNILLWSTLGLDYSTHTAVALSLVFALCALFPNKWKPVVTSMLLYAGLMLYQQYHSVLDIISTSVVIGLFAYVLSRLIFKRQRHARQGFENTIE